MSGVEILKLYCISARLSKLLSVFCCCFCTLIFKSQRGLIVNGWLRSDPSNCGYMNAVVIEHY